MVTEDNHEISRFRYSKTPYLSVVIPCYNEEKGLSELHKRVSSSCKQCMCAGEEYEIVLINDGSKDKTWEIMKQLSESDPHLVAVNLSRNHGHQLALSAGLEICRGERIFIIDADLQDPPELLEKMMKRMDEGCDVVFGQRIRREGETRFKLATAFIFYRLLNKLVEIDIPPDTGDFRLMSRRALNILKKMPEHHRFIRGMVSWIGMKQEAFPYERAPRFVGETKYPFFKMLKFAIDAITGFSVLPLKIAAGMGICFAVATFFLLIYVFVNYFLGHAIEGWTSLALIILLLGSIQLFVAAVMGEYLGRLCVESKGRPLFVIQEIFCSGKSDPDRFGDENEQR